MELVARIHLRCKRRAARKLAAQGVNQISVRTISYGSLPNQEGDLYLPSTPKPPVICLLHGGFWRMPYGRDALTPVAQNLAGRGLAVWNLAYRRLGESGGGWPGTFHDVAAGIDHLATVVSGGVDLDLNCVMVVGHSAGGQLALWAVARDRFPRTEGATARMRIAGAAGLAPIADLARAFHLNLGNGAVAELLGGSPEQQPERYAAASPVALLPLRVRQLIVHGTADDVVPIDLSRTYAQAANAKGDSIKLVELPNAGHMDFIDPSREAHAVLCRWLRDVPKTDRP